ncbi:SEC-C motif-containing protein [Saliterribacillus persicus]|uniref:SEC-C motif-containing protein n=1 Tax=Saliterribacillus persicus TaxID=930114 RepID=A0A368Y4G6_9BACI|nr:SEC-C motif-containing protein [Saliterribacillus persicus]
MVNYRLKAQVFEVVNNQIRDNNPKCTKRTFHRLIDLGYSESESKELIASILIEEMYDVMKNNEEFNESRFCEKLDLLPKYYLQKSSDLVSEEKTQIIVRNEQKIGRNALCPCGSGKKYKKCCG